MPAITRRHPDKGALTYWFADRFAEIEEKDATVTEVRMKRPPKGDSLLPMDLIDNDRRGIKYLWFAKFVLDKAMKPNHVRFTYSMTPTEFDPPKPPLTKAACPACGRLFAKRSKTTR